VGKVDIYDNFGLAGEYQISSIPRVLVFKGGNKPVRQFAGLVSERELAKALDEVLKG
jgi:thioredoxin 1